MDIDEAELEGGRFMPLQFAPIQDTSEPPASPFTRTPTLSGTERVVALGALCDFTEEPVGENPGLGISIFEHCILDDGQKVHLDERGFSWSPVRQAGGTSPGVQHSASRPSLEAVTEDVLNCVLPDDSPDGSEPEDDHPWEDLARSGREAGVQVTADELRRLTYFVEFTERVTTWIMADSNDPSGLRTTGEDS